MAPYDHVKYLSQVCDGGGDGNSGGWSMAIAAQVCIGAHLRIGVSDISFQENVRSSCAKSSPCTKG